MSQKEVIYIDVEDDITSIIDKATKPKASIIALVLPKKSGALKSSVNMKLLKNSTDKAKKKLVLITSEAALLPLAGAAGMHVAKDLKSRPSIPTVPKKAATEDLVEPEDATTLDTDETEEATETTTTTKTKSEKIEKIKKSSKNKVPNFDKFRLRITLIVLGLLGLIAAWYVMFKVMPSATVTIQAQTSRVSSEFDISLNSTVDELDAEKKIVPAVVQEITKTRTERFEATGEKDVGKKAKGTITVQNCDSSDPFTLPSGTTFTDSNTGFAFTSNQAVEVPGGSFSGGGCSSPGEVDVNVTATEGGDNRNLSPRSYRVSGVGNLVTGFGGQMSGGTSEIKKVVSAEDIAKARQELANKTDDNVRTELAALFGEEDIVIDETFTTTNTEPVANAKPGDERDEATISAEFTYSMWGIAKADLDTLLRNDQESQIDTESLSVLDTGIDEVALSVDTTENENTFVIGVTTQGYVGPEINIDALAQELTGKRFSEAIETVKSKPGVADVTIDLSPFWVFAVPGPEKTTITINVSE